MFFVCDSKPFVVLLSFALFTDTEYFVEQLRGTKYRISKEEKRERGAQK